MILFRVQVIYAGKKWCFTLGLSGFIKDYKNVVGWRAEHVQVFYYGDDSNLPIIILSYWRPKKNLQNGIPNLSEATVISHWPFPFYDGKQNEVVWC